MVPGQVPEHVGESRPASALLDPMMEGLTGRPAGTAFAEPLASHPDRTLDRGWSARTALGPHRGLDGSLVKTGFLCGADRAFARAAALEEGLVDELSEELDQRELPPRQPGALAT